MLAFIIKGLLRDKHRSLFPLIIISLGVMLTTFMYGYSTGAFEGMKETNAKLGAGHVKVMTKEYFEIFNQLPNDFAIINSSEVLTELNKFEGIEWVQRIQFGGLLDIPNYQGETRDQGPFIGMGMNLFGKGSTEVERMDLANVIKEGSIPKAPGEILVSIALASKLEVGVGDTATIIGSTASGGMAIHSFKISGLIKYGVPALDKNLVIADITDVQYALNMDNSAGEILGFFDTDRYNDARAEVIKSKVQKLGNLRGNSLIGVSLLDQEGLREYLNLEYIGIGILLGVFLIVMVVVLWNTGLMAGIRRYGEIGVRLAMGESKGELVRYLILESIVIGVVGSFIGSCLGTLLCLYLKVYGIDMSDMMADSSIVINPILRANVSIVGFLIGFIPGILAVVLGTSLSGIGIYKRDTASLFKELEV